MVRASSADQRALLDLQALDTRLAQLAHERRRLPVLTTLTDLEAHRSKLDAERVQLTAQLADQRRELARAEGDVDQVRSRSERHQDRLQSGGTSARDAQALQAEIEHLAVRASVLEDQQLEVMERVETTEEKMGQARTALESVGERVAAAESDRDAEFARIDADAAEIQQQRDSIAEALPSDLMALYERIREDTGGLGVIGLRNKRSEPVHIEFSLTELADFHAAPEDRVVVSDEHGFIIVRLS
ncbi:MAG TPA: hypothetical protein VFC82_08775 [Actinomycetaceae bacterium]|nr:hypothetical protein [Actinomycetaceae bacterium]